MSRKVAFGGILTALCLVLIYVAAYAPSGKLGLYALASVTIAAAVVELDIKFGVVVFAAAALLILPITGSLNALLLFVLFFGSYPLFKYYFEKQRNAAVEMLMKFGTFNFLVLVGYFLYKQLFGVFPINLSAFSIWITIGIALGGQIVFLIYDYVLSRLINYYINRIRTGFNRG